MVVWQRSTRYSIVGRTGVYRHATPRWGRHREMNNPTPEFGGVNCRRRTCLPVNPNRLGRPLSLLPGSGGEGEENVHSCSGGEAQDMVGRGRGWGKEGKGVGRRQVQEEQSTASPAPTSQGMVGRRISPMYRPQGLGNHAGRYMGNGRRRRNVQVRQAGTGGRVPVVCVGKCGGGHGKKQEGQGPT